MRDLPERINENGIDYILVGDYYIPDLKLPEEDRPIGRWGRMHRDYLKECRPGYYCSLLLTGKLWTYLADLDEQAEERLDRIIQQMRDAEGVTEGLKADDQMEWVRHSNSISNCEAKRSVAAKNTHLLVDFRQKLMFQKRKVRYTSLRRMVGL